MTKVTRAGLAVALVSALGWLASCSDEPAGPGSRAVSVTVTPPSATLLVQQVVQLTATVLDANGTVVPGRPIEWTSANPAVATVDSNGLATGIGPGSAAVIATSAGASDTAVVTVMTASITVTPPSATLLVQQAVQLTATVLDANGTVVPGRPIVWTSASPAVATVDPNGLATGIAPGSAAVIATSAGASDTVAVTVTTAPEGLIVSDPLPVAGLAAGTARARALADGAGDSIVYVSLPPGTAPAGSRAVVRRVGNVGSLITTLFDGGFDPVPVAAQEGDSIEVVVLDVGGGTVGVFGVAVFAARPPIVVRTDPPRKKTDVPLNASIVIVFSEPVDDGTLTSSSVQLLRGTTVVPGVVSLLQGAATAAVFTPSAPLDANTQYRLVVTEGVKDLDGDRLGASVIVEFFSGTTFLMGVDSVSVLPDTTALVIGSQVQLTAVLLAVPDTFGFITRIVGRPIAWSSDDPAVAAVSPTGLVTALGQGEAHVRADVVQEGNGVFGTAVVLVTASLAPVDSVEVIPAVTQVSVTGIIELTAVMRDTAGNVLPLRPVAWETSDANVATVERASGSKAVVTGVSAGAVTITATSEGKTATATVSVVSPGAYAKISAGESHTCGVTLEAWGFCWGYNGRGGLGNGTFTSSLVPINVLGGPMYSQVQASAGNASCALTLREEAYCWGTVWGWESTPLPVAGGLRFTAITVDGFSACGLTPDSAAYCWGAPSTVPAAVPGGLTFTMLDAGAWGQCGLIATGSAYCWSTGSTPVLVDWGLRFMMITLGVHACGVTSDSSAYCWGLNDYGQLGDGTATTTDFAPRPVVGGLRFSFISAGRQHSCGIASDGAAYCWGSNGSGQLGTGSWTGPEQCNGSYGTYSCSLRPVPVAGGLTFASVSAGHGHSCGVTVTGVAYCWGGGNLGNGTSEGSNIPVKVAGQP